MKKLLSAFLVTLSLSAFSQSNWKVQYVFTGAQMENVTAKKYDFLISIPEQKISGTVGCNQFHGTLDYTKGDLIKPIKPVVTKDKCPEVVDKAEKAVLDALHVASKLVISQDRAKFYHGEKLVLELKR